MRPLTSEPSGDDQPRAETEVDERAVDKSTPIRPTFTPAAREADDDATPDEEAVQTPTVVEPADDYPDAQTHEPLVSHETVEPAANYKDAETNEPTPAHEAPPAYGTSAAPTARPETAAPAAVSAAPAPAASADLDQPLLSGDRELLAHWHRVQLEFIDDPQVAVARAADIVEQAGQALVDALQQRQRQMRTMWGHSSAAAGDTEQLRQVMQRYRALFNQLYKPV